MKIILLIFFGFFLSCGGVPDEIKTIKGKYIYTSDTWKQVLNLKAEGYYESYVLMNNSDSIFLNSNRWKVCGGSICFYSFHLYTEKEGNKDVKHNYGLYYSAPVFGRPSLVYKSQFYFKKQN
jgi:hypothetical protein